MGSTWWCNQKILAWKKSHFCALNNQGDFIQNTGSPRTFRVEMDPLLLFKLGFTITIGGSRDRGNSSLLQMSPLTCLVTRPPEFHSKSCLQSSGGGGGGGESKTTYLLRGRPCCEEKWPFHSVQGFPGTCWAFDLPWTWSGKWSR